MNVETLLVDAIALGLKHKVHEETDKLIAEAKVLLDARMEEIVKSVEAEVIAQLNPRSMAQEVMVVLKRRTDGSKKLN